MRGLTEELIKRCRKHAAAGVQPLLKWRKHMIVPRGWYDEKPTWCTDFVHIVDLYGDAKVYRLDTADGWSELDEPLDVVQLIAEALLRRGLADLYPSDAAMDAPLSVDGVLRLGRPGGIDPAETATPSPDGEGAA